MADVKRTLFDGHLVSVVFSASNLALCPAMQAVCGILLEQDFVSRLASCVAIVSRALYLSHVEASLSFAGSLCSVLFTHVWFNECCDLLVFGVPSSMRSRFCRLLGVLSWMGLAVLTFLRSILMSLTVLCAFV